MPNCTSLHASISHAHASFTCHVFSHLHMSTNTHTLTCFLKSQMPNKLVTFQMIESLFYCLMKMYLCTKAVKRNKAAKKEPQRGIALLQEPQRGTMTTFHLISMRHCCCSSLLKLRFLGCKAAKKEPQRGVALLREP